MTEGASHSVMRSCHPIRTKPAPATHSASQSPRTSLARRVSRLPRIGIGRRSGRRALSCAARRGLLVPTRAPGGSSASRSPPARSGRPAAPSAAARHQAQDRDAVTSEDLWRCAPQDRSAHRRARPRALSQESDALETLERDVHRAVARGGDNRRFELNPGRDPPDGFEDQAGLPKGELAAAGPNAQKRARHPPSPASAPAGAPARCPDSAAAVSAVIGR